MKSPKCIHRVIPAPCKLPRRKQALAPVGAVDDHRAVFRNLRLHFIQPLIRQVHSPQEMSCLIFPLLPHNKVNVRSPSRRYSNCCTEIVRNIYLLLKHILNVRYAGRSGQVLCTLLHTKNVPWHILAPRAVACDNLHPRASAHLWRVSAFLCNRDFPGIPCYIKTAAGSAPAAAFIIFCECVLSSHPHLFISCSFCHYP